MAEVEFCTVCYSNDLDVLLDLGEQPLAEHMGDGPRYPLKLMQCPNCSLGQLSYYVDQKEVFPPDHPYTTGGTAALREHFAELAEYMKRHLEVDDLAIDIGANDGTLLTSLREQWGDGTGGLRLLAVEPTNQIAKIRGMTTWQGFFTEKMAAEIASLNGPAKVITATNVLAHVPDPHDFMRGVTRLLTPDGLFITENHDLGAVVDGLQIDTIYHEHLRYWNLPSLTYLLNRHGLTVDSYGKFETHGGSFGVVAKRKTQNFTERAQQARNRLHALIAAKHGGGARIWGVGATTRAPVLIHYAELARYIDCIVELPGSEKIGKFMPGTKIPVVDEKTLIEAQPEFALLFSWHLAEHIIPSLRRKGYKGQYIIPLPEARVTNYG